MIAGMILAALVPLGLVALFVAGWPPFVLAIPASVPLLLVVRGLRAASQKIDTIFAEELDRPDTLRGNHPPTDSTCQH
jgi:hypothetical protein